MGIIGTPYGCFNLCALNTRFIWLRVSCEGLEKEDGLKIEKKRLRVELYKTTLELVFVQSYGVKFKKSVIEK